MRRKGIRAHADANHHTLPAHQTISKQLQEELHEPT
jgi:hypothetical protein